VVRFCKRIEELMAKYKFLPKRNADETGLLAVQEPGVSLAPKC
jgi:hypothetical protein